MAQFDVYENADKDTTKTIPFLLDVQANLLDGLATRVVIPLIVSSAMAKAIAHLNPTFKVKGVVVVMSTAELAGIPSNELGRKVESLAKKRNEIISALDFLITGF